MKLSGIILLFIGLFILFAGFVELKKIEKMKISQTECLLEDIKNRSRMEYMNQTYSSNLPSTYAIRSMVKSYQKEKAEKILIFGEVLTFISLMILVIYKAKKKNEI